MRTNFLPVDTGPVWFDAHAHKLVSQAARDCSLNVTWLTMTLGGLAKRFMTSFLRLF
jgi:hypothetical protein